MAESKNNVLTHGLSGMVGDLIVFRNRGNKTIVASKPKERSGETTETQKAHQKKFQQAIVYGQNAVTNPDFKAEYQAAASDGQTAFNVAVADFFHAPDIESIDVSNYTGKIGDTIKVTVTDNFKVTGVSVVIYNADGSEVEHGLALQDDLKSKWVFTAKVENTSLDGDKIVVEASDLPGNISEKSESL